MIVKKICIMCPLSCELTIEKKGKNITVTGNACPRGDEYGRAEVTRPMRSFTSLVSSDFGPISVKTTNQIPKSLIKKALAYIDTIKINHKPKYHEVIEKNFMGTGTDLIVTSK